MEAEITWGIFLFYSHLNPSLCQVRPQRQLLASVNVWVVRLLENFLQLFQLVAGECRAVASLLAFIALRLAFLQRAGKVGPRALAWPLHNGLLQVQVAALHPRRINTWRKLRLCQAAVVFSCMCRDRMGKRNL